MPFSHQIILQEETVDSEKYKILIVEDNPDWRLTLEGMLNEAGFVANPVSSKEEALSALQAKPYDVALLDIRLDDSDETNDDGLLLAEEINKRWPEVRIIIATGYANQDYVKRAMEPKMPNGQRLAVNFIEKSDIVGLVDVIKKIFV